MALYRLFRNKRVVFRYIGHRKRWLRLQLESHFRFLQLLLLHALLEEPGRGGIGSLEGRPPNQEVQNRIHLYLQSV